MVMMADHNKELSEYVSSQIEQTLTEEWVQSEIKNAVDSAISSAIQKVSSNWKVQQVIEDEIANTLVRVIKNER